MLNIQCNVTLCTIWPCFIITYLKTKHLNKLEHIKLHLLIFSLMSYGIQSAPDCSPSITFLLQHEPREDDGMVDTAPSPPVTSESEPSRPPSRVSTQCPSATPTAMKRKHTGTSTPAEEVMAKATSVLEGLMKPKEQDHYDYFGVTVAGEVKNLPTDYHKCQLMVKIMQTIMEFKENLQSNSTISVSPQQFVAPCPVGLPVMTSQPPAPFDCTHSTLSPYQSTYTQLE